jgi:gluconokinase
MSAASGGRPAVLVVMGVSGSGKTTVAAMLAGRLGWPFEDADDLHPASNVEKMHAGVPLTDEDRWPWLRAVAAWIDDQRAAGGNGVVACSALRKAYRDVIVAGRSDVRLVYLRGEKPLVLRRQAARQGHFMPSSLVDSQFAALEEPGGDEAPIVVSIDKRPGAIVDAVVEALDAAVPPPDGGGGPG